MPAVNKPHGRLLRYGAAVLAVVLATGLARLWRPVAPTSPSLFLAAVALSAWYGGLGPGLVASVLADSSLGQLVLPPAHSAFSGIEEAAQLGVFGLVAVLISCLCTARMQVERAQFQALAREQAALAQAEAANRHKDQVLAFLGHELRSPLAAIRNTIQVLDQGDTEAATVAWGRVVIERQLKHITRLLEDLQDASRIGYGKIQLQRERLDLYELVRGSAEDHRRMLEAAGLTFQVELPAKPVWILGDPTRLVQVISNLLSNASKFTDPGGSVTLRITIADGCQWAAITVRDTGLGIEPDMLPHIFDMFVQAGRTRHHSQGGLGVGLALVKGLVELHGGKVRAASEGVGKGSDFTVWLPLLRESSGLQVDSSIPAAQLQESCPILTSPGNGRD
jgi:signal transduction histidine kinase